MIKYASILFVILLLFFGCKDAKIDTQHFPFFLSDPCMILNQEQDNTIEGTYVIAEEVNLKDSSVKIKIPAQFFITDLNCNHWTLGWGSNKPNYDAGVENICKIKRIDATNGIIYLGNLLRGNGFPEKNQRIIFLNTDPTGFKNNSKTPVINPSMWPEFKGKSIAFSSVQYDSLLHKWIMLVNECDTSSIQVYAAMSDNLINWQAANNGKPVLTASDFNNCLWAGKDKSGKISQTPIVSDLVRHNNKWYVFMDGYDANGKRNIGVAVSEHTLLGPFKVNKNAVLSVGASNSWNDEACFYAKVKKFKNGFIMFYDGRNSNGVERLGMAQSNDLINWKNSDNNPVIDEHTGWRSWKGCTEPNYIEVRNDSIFVLIAGVKNSKAGFWHHYVTKRMYLDVSGNVDQAQLGAYLSVDGGNHFVAHTSNPVFTNDYTNPYENSHMGGNFSLIKTDTVDYIFYQAKSVFQTSKYNILLRTKDKR